MNGTIEQLKAKEAGNPKIWLRVASERLSQLRYVYLVQIEDGIPSANQRSCLEYADAVLIGWPDEDADQVVDLADGELDQVREIIAEMEGKIPGFRRLEREGRIDDLSRSLVTITECVAQVRRHFQPDFPLPTYREIHQVVQQEWNEDMSRIDPDQVTSPQEVKQMQEHPEQEETNSHVGTGLAQGQSDQDGARSDGDVAATDRAEGPDGAVAGHAGER
ncbi:putative Phosphoribosylformylglycinamidine (FGAM) synthase, synthetase domain [Bifidobacterium actinocoloniiforme DSM 22766]|uniref:Putative Phosphoribosylformylglycinamidine (FGAM) synthase, synthetase domain n=1 Tax=Bifidobacterium actinocoloniiforme DSM 22766 TaxID=1437605 RepID=A0A086Z0M9_9BIFI|nr:phosphoribosylglycinamide synthetase [Bifidobacterium actinocoloniiforme]KFI40079.1 putative Phosphoribosylformylglycinamidine (FGAM) synthase, synthetase domain [Bifidobacterium actinocoloniiforme DSM 22766]